MLLFDQKTKIVKIVVSLSLNIKFGHTQISVPKISMLMSKTVCINLWWMLLIFKNTYFKKHLQMAAFQI